MSSSKPSKTEPKETTSSGTGKGVGLGNALGFGLVAAVCILVVWGLLGRGSKEPEGTPLPARPTQRAPAAAMPQQVPITATPGAMPTRTGQPWEYDADTNHHWDPRMGHQHWHQGPPPPEDQRSEGATPRLTPMTTQPGAPFSITPQDGSPFTMTPSSDQPTRTGEAWEYDVETDHHWDPREGHEHWHRGLPPDQR